MPSMIGSRVVRGPDWKWANQDGGEGHVGTIVTIKNPPTVAIVHWDSGNQANYRIGAESAYDLRILDNGPCAVSHDAVACGSCQEKGIAGIRWSCRSCPGCDLCSACYMADKHDVAHAFVRHTVPGAPPAHVPPRKDSRKVDSIGIFFGAKVGRGRDWKWADQDGGKGKIGIIHGLRSWAKTGARNSVAVKWESGMTNEYRLGYEGMVDVVCRTGASGGTYYCDHLPVLGDPDEIAAVLSHGTTATRPVQLSQQADSSSNGGRGAEAAAAVTASSSTVVSASSSTVVSAEPPEQQQELAVVSSGPSSQRLAPGDRVRVELPVEVLEHMQEGHGGWVPAMRQAIGELGTVSRLTPQGDVVVEYASNKKWIFHPDALVRVSETQLQSFRAGNNITVIDDVERLKRIQISRGGWIEEMHLVAGRTGRVLAAYPTGDLRVVIGPREWTINQDCCLLASSDGANVSTGLHGLEQLRGMMDGSGLLSMLMQGLLAAVSDGSGGGLGESFHLVSAAKDGNGSTVKALLGKSPHLVNERAFDVGALHVASSEGHTEVVKILLSHKADVMIKDREGNTPLHHSAMGGKAEVMKLLLSHGAAVNDKNEKGRTALHLAVDRQSSSCVSVLLAHPCNVNVQDGAGNTALHDAVALPNESIIVELAQHECSNPGLTNELGYNVLHCAAGKGNSNGVKKILSVSPQLCEQKTASGLTPLHIAAMNGHPAVIDVLIESGKADFEARTERQQTALLLAVFEGHQAAATSLIDFGADLSAQDAAGNTCLHYAVEAWINQEAEATGDGSALKCEELVQYLLKSGANVTCMNRVGKSSLDLASHSRVRQVLYDYVDKNTSDVPLTMCTVCSDAPASIIFRPCGHNIVCSDCCPRMKKCLECQSPIVSKESAAGVVLGNGASGSHGMPSGTSMGGQSEAELTGAPEELRRRVLQLEKDATCPICLTQRRNIVFNCGHTVCKTCAHSLTECHLCRTKVVARSAFFI